MTTTSLKLLRRALGVSQAEAASALGMRRVEYASCERHALTVNDHWGPTIREIVVQRLNQAAGP